MVSVGATIPSNRGEIMPSTPDLWGTVAPIVTWIEIRQPESPEHGDRMVSLRVRRHPGKSVTVTCLVDVYAPEFHVLRACSEVLKILELDQQPLHHPRVLALFNQQIANWVEPF
jgi:hypothetical protein